MPKSKTLIPLVAAALIGAGLLTGCGAYQSATGFEKPSPEPKSKSSLRAPETAVFEQLLPDGRTVLCVWASRSETSKAGGLSCDWESIAVQHSSTEEDAIEGH